jgi:hypothetical protein
MRAPDGAPECHVTVARTWRDSLEAPLMRALIALVLLLVVSVLARARFGDREVVRDESLLD